MPFDPTKPFEVLSGAPAPAFDPSQPFEQVQAGSFDPSKPSETLEPDFRTRLANYDAKQLADPEYGVDPVSIYAQEGKTLTPEETQKLADIHWEAGNRTLADVKPSSAIKSGWEMAWTLLKGATKAAKDVFVATAVFSSPEEKIKATAELAASLEAAGHNGPSIVRSLIRKGIQDPTWGLSDQVIARVVGKGTTPAQVRALREQTVPQADIVFPETFFKPEDRISRLQRDASLVESQMKAAQGEGAILSISPLEAEKLEKAGIKLDTQAIQEMSTAVDPVNFLPIGAVGKLGEKVSAVAAGRVLGIFPKAWASKGIKTVGDLVAATGAGVRTVSESQGLRRVSRTLGVAGAVGAGAAGDFTAGVPGAIAAEVVPRIAAATGRGVRNLGKGVSRLSLPIVEASDKVLRSSAIGAATMLPIAAAAETPEQQVAAIETGAVLGAAHATGAIGARIAGQRAGEFAMSRALSKLAELPPIKDVVTSDKRFQANYEQTIAKLEAVDPVAAQWVKAARLNAAKRGGQAYAVDSETFFNAIKDTPEAKAAGWTAKSPNLPYGHFFKDGTALFRFDGETVHGVIHEPGHMVDFFQSPEQRAAFDKLIQEAYGDAQISAFGKEYASALGSKIGKARTMAELRAEMYAAVRRGLPLDGVPLPVRKQALIGLAAFLESTGLFTPLIGRTLDASGVGGSLIRSEGISPRLAKEAARVLSTEVKPPVIPPPVIETPGAPPVIPPPAAPPAGPRPEPGLATPIPPELGAPTGRPYPEAVPGFPRTAEPGTPEPGLATRPPAELGRPSEVAPVRPEPATPSPEPAAPPVIETAPKVSRTDIGIQEAEAQVAASPDLPAEAREAFKVLRDAADNPSGKQVPVEIVYSGAKPEFEVSLRRRGIRRAEQEDKRAGGPVEDAPKLVIPTGFAVSPKSKTVQITAYSPDKVFANASEIVGRVSKAISEPLFNSPETVEALRQSIPYDLSKGKFTKESAKQYEADLKAYWLNQANGYTGTGEPAPRATGQGLFIPETNPNFTPTKLSQAKVDFLNATMGIAPPKTARVTKGPSGEVITPTNIRARRTAAAGGREALRPGNIKPGEKVPTFPSGEEVAEFNPVRQLWEQAGIDVRSQIEATERLNLADVKLATPRPDVELRAPVADLISAGFLPAKLQTDASKTGLAFKDFFSRVTRGEFGKSAVPFHPVLSLDGAEPFLAELAKHSGNFDDHISKSIPSFKETQVKTGEAIVRTYGDAPGAKVLDIAASEGSWAKTITARSGGNVETVALDPNPDMAKFFAEKSEVPGSTYVQEAFLESFEDAGKVVPAYDPKDRFDVVHESMGFQFISPDRPAQIAEAKRLLKTDGVLLVEEKVRNPDWAANEATKDKNWKNLYFSNEELKAKDAVVGFQQAKQETKAVGMVDNMVSQEGLEAVLSENFKHVVQYWDSGNFKGYAASDSPAAVSKLVSNIGDVNSKFSTAETPRTVTGGEFLPNAKTEVTVTGPDGTEYKARFDGFQDFSMLGKGKVPQITTLEEIPGVSPKNGTTYLDSLKKKGYTVKEIPADESGLIGGEFLPAKNTDKEHITLAALKSDDGRVWTGGAHVMAYLKADAANAPMSEDLSLGFVTSEGRFVDRREAYKIATESGQTTPEALRSVAKQLSPDAENLPVSDELESFALSQTRQFLPARRNTAVRDLNAAMRLEPEEFELRKKPDLTDAIGTKGFNDAVDKAIKQSDKSIAFFRATGDEAGLNAEQARRKWLGGLVEKKAKPAPTVRPKNAEPTQALTGWILPDGEFASASAATDVKNVGDFHMGYLRQNADTLAKRFGFKSKAADPRGAALSAGFARTRYEASNGALHIEAPAAAWRKIKDSVIDLVAGNADKIDKISVSLLDKDGKLVRGDEASVFDVANEEKVNHIPLLDEAGGNFLPAKAWATAKGELIPVTKEHVDEAAKRFKVPVPRGEDSEAWLEINERMIAEGGIRLNVIDDTLYAEGKYSDWLGIPRKTRDKILDYSLEQEAAVRYNGRWVDEGPGAFLPTLHKAGEEVVVPRQQSLFGGDVVEYNRAAIGQMNRKELATHFPEAIKAPAGKAVPSDLLISPRYKAAKNRAAAVADFADKLAEQYKAVEDSPEVQVGRRWYSDFTPKLKEYFGDDSQLFAELLAATSPQTAPDQNFADALEAFRLYKQGAYDRQISKFKEGMARLEDGRLESAYRRARAKASDKTGWPENPTPEGLLARWIEAHDLIPTKEARADVRTGEVVKAKFHQNSRAVLWVLAREWLNENRGPKTSQFVQNLLGQDHGATIDLWADRTLREIGYKDYVDRWRILPENKAGISDAEFAFGQEVFAAAAKKLGLEPSELQGAMWFAEKRKWADNGWGPLDFGDFRREMSKVQTKYPTVEDLIRPRTKSKLGKQVELDIVKPRK